MNKNRIRLTESQLHRVINESIKRVLKEGEYDDYYYTPSVKGETQQSIGRMNEKLMHDYIDAYISWVKTEKEIKDAVKKYVDNGPNYWSNFMYSVTTSSEWLNRRNEI